MTVIDKIHQRVRILPEPLQAEVLDFVEFLLSKKQLNCKITRRTSTISILNGQTCP